MARKRYPSDDKRLKRPSGVVIGFSIRNPDPARPGHAHVFEDPEQRGIWVGLLVVAGQAFAGRHGDLVTLSSADLSWVTGRTHRGPALERLRVVCESMGYYIEDRGRSVVIHVKNLSKNQGWTTRTSADSDADSAELPPHPSPSPIPSTLTSTGAPESAESRAEVPEGSPARELAELLRLELVSNVANFTPPKSLRAWSLEIDRMLRLDGPAKKGIPAADIADVIRWCVRDSFWSENIHSARSLRKHFPKLFARMRNGGKNGRTTRWDHKRDKIQEAAERSRQSDQLRFGLEEETEDG